MSRPLSEFLAELKASLSAAELEEIEKARQAIRKYGLTIEIDKMVSQEEVQRLVRYRMADLNVNQGGYAKHLGVSGAYVSAVMNGHKQPSKRMRLDLGIMRSVNVPANEAA